MIYLHFEEDINGLLTFKECESPSIGSGDFYIPHGVTDGQCILVERSTNLERVIQYVVECDILYAKDSDIEFLLNVSDKALMYKGTVLSINYPLVAVYSIAEQSRLFNDGFYLKIN